jgi:sugar-specific transcriptional regulator TrmB
MTTKEQQNFDKVLKYFALCQSMIQVIEDEWEGNPANRQMIKQLTKQLVKELKKTIEILLPTGDYSEQGMRVTEQFIDATEAMLNFYQLGTEMARMDDDKGNLLVNELNELLKKYDINTIV